MRITAFLVFVALMQASAASYAQKVTLSEKNVHLSVLFEKIRDQTGFDILYTRAMLDGTQPVSLSVKNAPLEEVLRQAFSNQPLQYELRNRAVVVSRRLPGETVRVAGIDVRGRVLGEEKIPLPGASVKVAETGQATVTGENGRFELSGVESSHHLLITFIGYQPKRIAASAVKGDIQLQPLSQELQQVVVTAMGIKQESRALGTAVTVLDGKTIQDAQRENFINALQGRVAGIEVANTSGLPGSSSSIVIRGITSLSGNNQPLFIVDGLPIDNTTFGAETLASNSPGSSTGISSKNLDFSNRAADINPDDIESITVLKGPEASALYGIDAASGAIVITTKKGKAGAARINYQNSFKVAKATRYPEIQQVYGQGVVGAPNAASFMYLGPKYAEGEVLYDNIKPFFRNAFTQKHNISFEGGTDRATYRLSSSYLDESGIIGGADLKRLTVTSATSAKISRLLTADVTLSYINQVNNQVFKGANGALLGLLTWPTTDDARNYLNPDGSRRAVGSDANLADEPENPYFLINKNKNQSTTNRVMTNAALTLSPVSWFTSKGQVGLDVYATDISVLRHPESNFGYSKGGLIDNATVTNKNLNIQWINTFRYNTGKFKTSLLLGGSINDSRYVTHSVTAENFQVPDFFNINNTQLGTSRPSTIYRNRYLAGVFSNLNVNYGNLLYLTLTGRNDWTSTLAPANRSFPSWSAQLAFIYTELEAFRNIPWLSFGKLRGSVGSTGKDAPPYSIYAALENQVTTGGGYAYGFTGPSPNLRAERTRSYEAGMEMKLFRNRLGIDVAYYRKNSLDQIISDLRLSYATGSVLQVLNGGDIWNKGVEIQLEGTPVKSKKFSWNILANFNAARSRLVRLPQELPEFYVSTTRLGSFNVRNGAVPGESVTSFTGKAYLRNNRGDILINPATGLPLREATDFKKIGDRNPDFTAGLTNTFRYGNLSLSFLLDMRKGGDIFNGTELYLVNRGLSMRTLNREEPVVFKGVLKDGLENTDHPTVNTRQIVPYFNVDYYSITAGTANEEDFIERDINWIRMKDVTLSYELGKSIIRKARVIRTASVFFTATDLFLITNYSGLDPVVNGNNASIGGSGSVGFDFGNFAFPVGLNFGIRLGL
ncbi:SusC/RagA family TonB-linked outer membrane protein [Chitinophaga sp.]|uniref:SusC/RagA family TonB-linked outer membrane protein n=1 Tax=Chitinophaga sp. TaxID=1869181 RepID=UPI0031E06360